MKGIKAAKGQMHKSLIVGLAVMLLGSATGWETARGAPDLVSGDDAAWEIYVSPAGSDETGDGSEPSPFGSLAKARDTARLLMAGGMTGNGVIVLREGTHQLAETLVLDDRDSGRDGHKVIYRAYPGEEPVISGGQEISGWLPVTDGVYKAATGGLDFRQLYINGERGIRARTPNAGSYYRVKSYNKTNLTIQVEAAHTAGLEGGAGTPEMIVQTHWDDRHLLADSFTVTGDTAAVMTREPERSTIVTSESPLSEPGQSYHWENKLAFLDQAGEWFLDKEQQEVYYKPRTGEDMSTAVVVAPRLETLVKLAGTLDQSVQHMEFRGLRFEHSTWLKPNDGYAGTQATYYPVDGVWYGGKLPGAVQLEAAGNIRFERNTFRHLGATGLDLVAGNFDNTIEGNVFTDISGNGLAVGSRLTTVKAVPEDPRVTDRRTTVRNNYLSRVGQDYYGAVGIFGGYVEEMNVVHNELTDMPYSGISVGWGFTTNDTALKNNTISNNRISDVMGLLDDGGGIYTLSYQPGTEIKENYIYNILRSPWTIVNYPEKEWWKNLGIYLDQNSSGMTVMNNVILNAERLIKTNQAPYGTGAFIRNHADLAWVKENAGIEPAYRDIRLAEPAEPPAAPADVTPPQLVSAATDEAGTEIVLHFSEPLEAATDSGILDASRFMLSGTDAVVSSAVLDVADVKSATVKLALDKTAGYGNTVALALAQGAVKDAAGNAIAASAGNSVSNLTLIPYLMKVDMIGSPIMNAGDTAWPGAYLTDRSGQPVAVGSASFSYASADPAVADVDGQTGEITAVGAGETDVAIHAVCEGIAVAGKLRIYVSQQGQQKPSEVNIARNKPVLSGTSPVAGYPAEQAVDGNINTIWTTGAASSLTVDLGDLYELYRIKRIEFVTRQDVSQTGPRKNFTVLGANDDDFADSTVLGSRGADLVPHQGTWTTELPTPASYRYIRFNKPTEYAAVAELRIIAEPVVQPLPPSVWPAGSKVDVVQGGYGQVHLSWTPAAPAPAAYQVSVAGQTPVTVSGAVYGLTVDNWPSGATRLVKVKAMDAQGNWSLDGPAVSYTADWTPSRISLGMNGSPLMSAGETARLVPALLTGNGQLVSWGTTSWEYESAHPAVAAVDASTGDVTAVTSGTARITVRAFHDNLPVSTAQLDLYIFPQGQPKPGMANMAQNRITTSASAYVADNSPDKATDNSISTIWATSGTASLTVDLGESYPYYNVARIEVVTRQDVDQSSPRKNFEIRGSQTSDFAEYTVLGSQGDTAVPFKSTWSADVAEAKPYRYIRFVKTANYAVVAELRVLVTPAITLSVPE
ncbi:MAG: xlnA 7 [Paenibacillaceae bacterium]|jgi:hypothetical protein|nr:xlnA 7 [Paenibacillaceae bacterium]